MAFPQKIYATPEFVLQGSFTDGPDDFLDAPRDVAVQGDYAFITSNTDGAITILDISDPTSPTKVGEIQDDNLINRRFIEISGNYAYVGGWGANQLRVYDISDKTNPTFVTNIGLSSGFFDLIIRGNYLYTFGQNTVRCFTVVDISNPAAPTEVLGVDHASQCAGVLRGEISGNYIYTFSSSGSAEFLTIYDISTPAAPVFVGSWADSPAGFPNANCQDLHYYNDYIFCPANGLDRIISIDVSDKENPVFADDLHDATYLDAALYAVGISNYLIVGSLNSDSLVAIDMNQPDDLSIIAQVQDSVILDGPYNLLADGEFVFVPAGNAHTVSIWKFNVLGPTVSDVQIAPDPNAVTITWATNEASSTQLEWGETTGYGAFTSLKNTDAKVTTHSETLTNLKFCQNYHFRILTQDEAGNTGISANFSTKTACTHALGGPKLHTDSGPKIALAPSGRNVGGVFDPNLGNTAGSSPVKIHMQEGIMSFPANVLTNVVSPLDLEHSIGIEDVKAPSAHDPLILIRERGVEYWQMGHIHQIWFVTQPPDSLKDPAVIVPDLQSGPSVVSINFTDDMLFTPGAPPFPKHTLRMAHSIDGVNWTIMPSSIVDVQGNSVAAVTTVGGYYMMVRTFGAVNPLQFFQPTSSQLVY